MELLNEMMLYAQQNPIMVGLAAAIFVLVLVYQMFQNKKEDSGVEIEAPDRVSLDQKVKEEFQSEFKQSGRAVKQPIYHKSAKLGKATKMLEKSVPADRVLSYQNGRQYQVDTEDDEELPEEVQMYYFEIKPSSKIQRAGDWMSENIFSNDTKKHYRIVRKEAVLENASGIHISSDVDFVRHGGAQIEETIAGFNSIAKVPMNKALEMHVNDKDEYAKKTDHMDREHSKAMGKYEKEAELEERRFGDRLRKR